MFSASRLLPFLRWNRITTRETLRGDLIAAITNAVVVIPQGVAFASIAGLPPEYGLYAGMIPAIIGALFGSSWHLVSGPTLAGSIVLFSVLSARAEPGSAEYLQLALTLTLMVGVIQLSLGLLRLGAIVNFISHSVLVGFTAGAAVLIAASQLRHFLGIDVEAQGRGYLTVLTAIGGLPDTNIAAVAVGVATIASGLLAQRLIPVIPNMLVALFAGTLAAAVLELLMPAGTRLSYLSTVPSGLPPLSMPLGALESFTSLAPAAVALTLFALTEAVSIARSLAIRSGQNLDSNQEFIGQGLSNVAGSFFSAYVATGSFNRSALNYLSGARTPLAAVLAGGLLMLMVPLVAPYVDLLPKAAMAGVLFLVAWGLIDFHHIRKILRASPAETGVLATTFFSAIFLDLEFAILLGVMSSLFLFMWDAVRPRIYSRVPDPQQKNRSFVTDPSLNECPQIKFLRIDGSLFFGAIHHVQKILAVFERRQPNQQHLVLIATAINRIDVSGAEFLAKEAADRRAKGGQLYLYRANESILQLLQRGGYMDAIGEENIYRAKTATIADIVPRVNEDICRECKQRIFRECMTRPGGASVRREEGRRRDGAGTSTGGITADSTIVAGPS